MCTVKILRLEDSEALRTLRYSGNNILGCEEWVRWMVQEPFPRTHKLGHLIVTKPFQTQEVSDGNNT